jgi:hypothetical protein
MATCEREIVYSFDADDVVIRTCELVAKCLLPKNREKFMQVLHDKMHYAKTQNEVDEVVGFLNEIGERTELGKEGIGAALCLCEKSQLMRKVLRGMVTIDEIPLNEGVVELMQYYSRNGNKIIIITKNEETDLIGEILRRKGVKGVQIFVEHGDKSAVVEKLMNERGWLIVHCDNDLEHKKSFYDRFGQFTPHFVLIGEKLEFQSLKEAIDDAKNRLLDMAAFPKNLLRDQRVVVPTAIADAKPVRRAVHVK